MGSGHGHVGGESGPVQSRRWARRAVLALVALSTLAALVGVVRWWPEGDRLDRVRGLVPATAPGFSVVHARLDSVRPLCSGTAAAAGRACGSSTATVEEGRNAGRRVRIDLDPTVVASGLVAGDPVLLLDGSAARTAGVSPFSFYRADRGGTLVWLGVLFALVVVLVAWRRGLMALLSLGFAVLVVVGFLMPALLVGRPAIPVTVAASVLVLVVMLYLTHGVSLRTSVALLGALVGIGLSTLYAWLAVGGTHLAGIGDDAAGLLTSTAPWVRVQALVVSSVILAGLGTLNDVTITQVSALWELRAAAPAITRWELFRSAMRIGRDHVASTVYTLVFAYLGTSLVLLVAVQLLGGTPITLLTAEDVAEEIVRTLVGGIALVLAMPITTAIGTLVLEESERALPPLAVRAG